MIEFSKTDLDTKWQMMPYDIRLAIISGNIENAVEKLSLKYNLNLVNDNVVKLTRYAIYGLIDQQTLLREIKQEVSPSLAITITKEIIKDIIIPALRGESELGVEETSVIKSKDAPAPKNNIPIQSPLIIHAEDESMPKGNQANPIRADFYEGSNKPATTQPTFANIKIINREDVPQDKSIADDEKKINLKDLPI